MSRKSAEFFWNIPISGIERQHFVVPPEVAYYGRNFSHEKWKAVTWKDIHTERTNKIKANEHRKRAHDEIKPCYVWVLSQPDWLRGGYYTLIKTIHKEFYLNLRGSGHSVGVLSETLQLKVMELFPLCIPIPDLFENWMRLFVKTYRKKAFGKPWKDQGIAKAWCKLSSAGSLLDIASNPHKLTIK